VVISGGGTGGHIFPALSVANRLEQKGVRTIYIGSNSGLERKIVHRDRTFLLPTVGWVGRNIFGKADSLLRFIPSIVSSLYILQRYRPEAILLTGGFASVPIGIAGIVFHVPIFTLVLDSNPGLAARFFSRHSKEVFLPFNEVVTYGEPLKKTVTGIPLREDILSGDRNDALRYFSLDTNKKTLLVLGGSRGARFLVTLADKLFLKMDQEDWQFIIQTGKHKLKGFGENIRKISFIERMDFAYALADVIISRAGAMVTHEIESSGIPTIFIPYPYAYRDHQFHNAKRLALKRENVVVMREKDVDVDKLTLMIDRMAGKRLKIAEEDSTEKIIKRMEHYVRKN